MQRLIKKLAVVSVGVVGVSVVVYLSYLRWAGLTYDPPKNLLPHPANTEPYEMIKVGNSHAEEGITFARYQTKSLNLASVAQTFEYDLAKLKMYHREIDRGAVVMVTVGPISFSERKAGREDGFEYTYYDGQLSPLYIPRLKVGDYVQSRVMPFLRAGWKWRDEYNQALVAKRDAEIWTEAEQRRLAEEAAKPPTPTPKPRVLTGWLAIPEEERFFWVEPIKQELQKFTGAHRGDMDESVSFTVDKWYNTEGFDPKYFATNREDLGKLLTYCMEQGWRPVVVLLPLSQELSDRLGPDYMQEYVYDNLGQVDLAGVPVYDWTKERVLTENVSLWINADHLSKKGAAIFSYVLLRRLIDDGVVPAGVDGYLYGMGEE